ncbi:Tachykinin-like peptides receptor 99D [Polyplax serrata]|uniref:Tachykinin-like peptides receptor 99D n=1 Tax=Polyplax serrata TaxID=468196 RepID=A0AAN8SDU9_POLSC
MQVCRTYMAIMNPLRPRMGRKMTLAIAAGIWIVGTALSIPNLIFYTLEVVKFENGHERRVCYMIWPDGPTNESIQEYWYNVIFMLLTYVLPIGSMTYTYTKIGMELWGSQSIGECTQRQLENIKSKRRVVKMMIVVVVIFMLCWLPFHIYFILTSHFPEVTQTSYIKEVFLAIYWLAMSNAMYNPIIYCWMNSRFRRGFKEIFRWCPGVEVGPGLLSRRDPVTAKFSVSGSPEAACRILRNGSIHIPLRPVKGGSAKQQRSNKKYKANGADETFACEGS